MLKKELSEKTERLRTMDEVQIPSLLQLISKMEMDVSVSAERKTMLGKD